MEGVFLFTLVLSSGVKEFCILRGSVFVHLLYVIVCEFIHTHASPMTWGHLELRGAPTVYSCHMESSTSTRCWHENKRSPFRQGGLDNPSALKTVCLFRLLDKHLFSLGVWRQAKLPRWCWGRATAATVRAWLGLCWKLKALIVRLEPGNSHYCESFLLVCRNPQGRLLETGELDCWAWASTQRDGMYGLLCESLHDFIKESYGDDVWKLVRERADVRLHSFVTHQVQPLEMRLNCSAEKN